MTRKFLLQKIANKKSFTIPLAVVYSPSLKRKKKYGARILFVNGVATIAIIATEDNKYHFVQNTSGTWEPTTQEEIFASSHAQPIARMHECRQKMGLD